MSRYPYLDAYKIPHKVVLTDKFVNWLMKIAEIKPFLDEHLGTPLELSLVRQAKVRAVTSSNQIEGNQLGEGKVAALLSGQEVEGTKKDIKEILNYQQALDYIETLARDDRPLAISDFCDVQRLVTRELVPEQQCGRVRTIPVSIANAATGEKISECPEPHELRDLLEDLWRWLEDTKSTNAFARAFAFHFIAVSIHPFVDGNGRSTRLMQHLLLLKTDEKIARFVPSETAIMENRDRYYSSIRNSQSLGSMEPILEFLAECFAISAQQIAQEGKKLLRANADRKPQVRHKKILKLAESSGAFGIQQVVIEMPDVPRRTLERDLEILCADGSLKASGIKKARKYEMTPAKKPKKTLKRKRK